ncbi:uncharacterized protein SAPINGB_P000744 [Magnusiomyces paraingens]|uniref:F-box domain-containing protein n=1 Tax=Magnusiomyces paraingens TaxID=2606893 RepID=A0A5E8B2V2_9ASCO|nr:uncharacterized protein SAPINGB_P000744 [Saprochaete ingens]VVT45420.1 unnamed protein product [Saprochaete ingens]
MPAFETPFHPSTLLFDQHDKHILSKPCSRAPSRVASSADFAAMNYVPDFSLSPASAHTQTIQLRPTIKNNKNCLENMPTEILTQILQDVILQECNGNPANYYSTVDRFSRLLTICPALYDVGTPILYRHVAFAHPHAFDRFLTSIEKTGYGVLTRTLDFSGFTSVGLGRSSRMNQEIQMVTSRTILRALELCPNLNEFLASENIDRDMDAAVVEKLFSLPYLQALDFCGATNSTFVEAIATSCGFYFTETGALERITDKAALAYYSRPLPHITRLSLHGCSTLPSAVIGALLQRLPNLTRLDLTHTQITSDALLSLPSSAHLTHLSISKCVRLSSDGTLKFLVLHKAARTLKWLNMMFEATRPSPISAADLATVLRYLPPLEYLNLHGLPVRNLDPLVSMDLVSLSLGYVNVTIDDLKRFLPKLPRLEYVDLAGNPNINIWTIQDLTLLNANTNIAMFEFNRDLLAKLDGIVIPGFTAALGQGRRGWLFRGDRVPTNKTLNSTTCNGPSVINGTLQEMTVTSPQLQPTQGFTFAAYAKNRIREKKAAIAAASASNSPTLSPVGSPEARPVTVLGMDMGSPAWRNASRKVNVCFVGLGGNMTANSCKERGIYLYYGYRK